MGSYAELRFDSVLVDSAKSVVPDVFVSLFQEADRKVDKLSKAGEEDEYSYKYTAPRAVILQRMDIMGFTAGAACKAFEEWRAREIADKTEWSEEYDWAADELGALKYLSFAEWQSRVPGVLGNRYKSRKRKPKDKIDERMLDTQGDGWLFFETSDVRLTIRAMLDACTRVKEVTLDISDPVAGGYVGESKPVCSDARKPDVLIRPVLESIVILAEGSTDIRVLKRSLAALYPELADYFSFFDHHELSVDGGANYLSNSFRRLPQPAFHHAWWRSSTMMRSATRRSKRPQSCGCLPTSDCSSCRILNWPVIIPASVPRESTRLM